MLSPLDSLVAVFSVSIASSKKEMLREKRVGGGMGVRKRCESSGGKAGLPTEVGVRCAER